MANNVSTDTPGMRTARTFCESTSTGFSASLRSVNSEMGALQASWTGDASRNFNTAMDSWEQCFQNVIGSLNNMIESLGGSALVFDNQEADAAGVAQDWSAAIPLPGFKS